MAEYTTISTTKEGDWNLNTYAKSDSAIFTMVNSNLQSVVGTSEYDLDFGIDQRAMLNEVEAIQFLSNSVHKMILLTAGIVEASIQTENIVLQSNRTLTIPYTFRTVNNTIITDAYISKI